MLLNKNVLLGYYINGHFLKYAFQCYKREFKVENYFHLLGRHYLKERLGIINRQKRLMYTYSALCILNFHEIRNRHVYFIFFLKTLEIKFDSILYTKNYGFLIQQSRISTFKFMSNDLRPNFDACVNKCLVPLPLVYLTTISVQHKNNKKSKQFNISLGGKFHYIFLRYFIFSIYIVTVSFFAFAQDLFNNFSVVIELYFQTDIYP